MTVFSNIILGIGSPIGFPKVPMFHIARTSCTTIFAYMKNVTDHFRRKSGFLARVRAAEQESSVSRFIGGIET